MPRGGYRKPTNPAPVSGPGVHSRRTDGKQPIMDLPDAAYGDGAQFRQDQAGAPLPQAQQGVQAPAGGAGPAMPAMTGLDAPTQWPDTPVTSGADAGPGPAMASMGIMDPSKQDAQWFARYLPTLIDIAQRDDTPPGTKNWVRSIIAKM